MTPADGSDFPREAAAVRAMPAMRAALLQGGVTIVFFEGAEAPVPQVGRLAREGAAAGWTALCWRGDEETSPRWSGVAVLDAPPAPGDEVRDPAAPETWRFVAPPRLDVSPDPLAAFVRRAGRAGESVATFLIERLTRDPGGDAARRGFLRALIAAAAERDGFVELIGAPDTGGLFAQGWSMSLAAGPGMLRAVGADLADREIEVAHFERDDVLDPARGVCLFGKFWCAEDTADFEAIYFARDGRLLRLDVVRDAPRLVAERATAHLAKMLPRLSGPDGTRAALRRICRPRFGGVDTLSRSALPVAAALDTVLRAPDGGLLIRGWLLDPLRRVERALLKSTANLYARLDADWCALPRPDILNGFAADPRFAALLDPSDAMHGFIVHAPADATATDGAQVYLELVLDDGACLFRPVTVTPFETGERLAQILGGLAPSEAELPRLVEDHLAPFLASVPPAAGRRADTRRRPIPLGGGPAGRAVTAVVPFTTFEELQPMLALLAATPEAAALDLALVASQRQGAAAIGRLGPAFEFYGLRGGLTLAPDPVGFAARCDLALEAKDGEAALCWSPAALPKAPGWLARMRDEATGLETPGLISPALTYEDGSIHFGGGPRDATGAMCALSGYGPGWLVAGPPRRAAAGAAQVALIGRDALRAAGGFAGRLFGDAHAHVDLAERLERAGFATWCSGAVEFWLMDEPPGAGAPPIAAMVRRIDAALLGRRGRPIRERSA